MSMTPEQFATLQAELDAMNNHPELHARNTFAHDVVAKYKRYGSLSELQLAALGRSLQRDRDRAAAAAYAGDAPVGAQTVTGTVLTIREKTDQYGTRLKMMVQLENGSRVYATVPKGAILREGDTVTFSATFEQAKNDRTLSFGSRPKLVTPATVTPPAGVHDDKPPSVLAELLAEL